MDLPASSGWLQEPSSVGKEESHSPCLRKEVVMLTERSNISSKFNSLVDESSIASWMIRSLASLIWSISGRVKPFRTRLCANWIAASGSSPRSSAKMENVRTSARNFLQRAINAINILVNVLIVDQL